MPTDPEKEIYYKLLAHVTTEVENSYHQLSASWRCRRASGVVQRPDSQKAMV